MQDLQKPVEPQLFAFVEPTRRLVGLVGLAIALGIAYFLAARMSIPLINKPDGIAVFWPAAGVAAGILIALGPGARLPVAAGAMAATIVVNLLDNRTVGSAIAFALFNGVEPVLVAGLIEFYFGSAFSLGRLRNVLGLLAAAIVGTAVSGIGWTVVYVLSHGSTAPVLSIWYHWVTSDTLGVVTVAPLLIGLVSAARGPPPRSEVIEGAVALIALTFLSGLMIFFPREFWATVAPIALLFPLLLWLAARCGPVFAAAAAFIVAVTIVWTTTFSIGIFGDANFPLAERILIGQAGILTVSLCAFTLAALFAERRESEARLIRSNISLQREQNNKLINMEAMAASIAHEVKQPLSAIAMNGSAVLLFLEHSPPNIEEARLAVSDMVSDGHRASEVFDNIRAMFRTSHQDQQAIDVNEIALGTLTILQAELKEHGVITRTELTTELPRVMGHRGQLQEVMLNLVRNAIEAMDATESGKRTLQVKIQQHGREAIAVAVEDSGPGIDPKKLEDIFDAFVTTKPHGTGLGLAICRMIIEHHGGRLTASSDGKRGALFQFVLPIEIAAPAK